MAFQKDERDSARRFLIDFQLEGWSVVLEAVMHILEHMILRHLDARLVQFKQVCTITEKYIDSGT